MIQLNLPTTTLKSKLSNRSWYLLVLGFAFFFMSKAQNEARFWNFGNQASLDFATSPPTSVNGCALNTLEGCATISSGAGNLLFYTDGITVYNSSNVMMANGNGLFGNSSTTQSGIIVKKPGFATIYYLFTLDVMGGPNGLCYSLVDMTLAAGMGSVTSKNVNVYAPSCEKVTAIRHCNGTDFWILSHEKSSNNFRSYLLSASGLNALPVISSAGYAPASNIETLGQMKVSPQGNKIGLAILNTNVPAPIEVYDFNPATGIVSSALTLTTLVNAYGCEFSPDGTKFYGAEMVAGQIFQWDLCAGSPTAIVNSMHTYTTNSSSAVAALQVASDGKIYMARSGSTLSVIDSPNLAGAAANYINVGLVLTFGSCQLGLPNFVNSYFKSNSVAFTSTLSCLNTASFSTNLIVGQTNNGCSSTTNSVSALTWNFGDPNSGSANSVSGQNVSHSFSGIGTYTVKLKAYYPCYTDSAVGVISVLSISPPIAVTGQFIVCKGENRVYTCSGASTYSWSNGAMTSSVNLSPTVTTVYSVIATATNSCQQSKSFTITVNKCSGIDEAQTDFFSVGPNPFSSEIKIHCQKETQVELRNAAGIVVLDLKLPMGDTRVVTEQLASGIYSLHFIGTQNSVKKMIKVQ